jgi:hypothetical protein
MVLLCIVELVVFCGVKMLISHEELLKVFYYNKDTGDFKYKNDGHICRYGYRCFKINGRNYRLNRLVWFYTYGVWPKNQIDHINGIRDDDRLVNLRDVTHFINQQNRKSCNKNNKLNTMGVYKVGNKYRARIMLDGKTKHLGYFLTIQDAEEAYINYKETLSA